MADNGSDTGNGPMKRTRTILIVCGVLAIVIAVGVTVGLLVRGGGDSDDEADGPKNASYCRDVEFIGAAGSGQRDEDPEDSEDSEETQDTDSGVGEFVEATYNNLDADMPDSTSSALRPVDYPALAVPVSVDTSAWDDYFQSVEDGATASRDLISTTADDCPESKIVVAGYSQGAMAIRRALTELDAADAEAVDGGVLIGDGDKLPEDAVTLLPDTDTDGDSGIAQVAKDEWGVDSGASSDPLASEWESKIMSACNDGDIVCALGSFDINKLIGDLTNGSIAHRNYDAEDWREFLLDRVTD